MKENINSQNLQDQILFGKKNHFNKQSKTNSTLQVKQHKVQYLKPSKLLLKKQRNEIPPNLQKKSKIIELLNTKDISSQISSSLPLDTPLFEAIPPVVVFSNYEALKVKTQILKLRNRDTVARRVKLIYPETSLFQIQPIYQNNNESLQSNKIAPGLDFTFEIKFSPESKTDYKYELIVVTEREKFIIPIIAIGKKPLIVFPDTINFGNSCPVKYYTEKPIIIHNKGEKATKWEIKLPENFQATKEEGILGESCSEQIVIKFYPIERKYYSNHGFLYYDDDVAQFDLLGNAINGEVYLSKNYIQQEETYISLESRDSFKIVNKSSVKISFQWRAFQSEKEENEKKKILFEQIDKEEAEKRILIYDTLDLEENLNIMDNDNSEIDYQEGREDLIKKRKKAEILLDRKYKAIRKAITEDTLCFEDDIFSIQPQSGSIWPNSEMTITVIFKPSAALKYLHQAYCNISCSDQRLPLYLEGEGLGPKAFLSTNSLSINDIFVNDKQLYNIYIENKGEIPAKFQLIKNQTSFSQMISFDVEEAELEVGQRMNIIMTFQSQKVGEFQELFRWQLQGSTEVLSLLVRGHVQAPKFEFSRKLIDFQKVSYQFEKVEEVELTNMSTVPFQFGLRIPQDGKGEQREFEIVPSKDEIQPNETKKIKLKFVPHFRKVYKNVMVLDIDGIGKDMKSIPILAESLVPKVKVSPQRLEFGDIFLRFQQSKKINLHNESDLHARFIVHKLSSKFEQYGQIVTDLDKGQISPHSSIQINITLITTCIKAFEMDFVIEIVSNIKTQHLIKVTANSIGPIVELSKKEINFGDVDVLTKKIQTITLTNKSVIPADFFAFTKNKNSVFRPIQKRYILKPQESFDVDIICYADDQQKFSDVLFFVIKEGVDKEVTLRARGIGSTIFCKEINNITFGTLYTHKAMFQEIFLENKGRRTQNLRWQRKVEKKEDNKQQLSNVFTIYPEIVTLPAKTGLMFQFKAFSTQIGEIEETYQLTSAIGTERKTNNILASTITGSFIKPSLKFSQKNIEFVYIWKEDQEPQVISQNLEIECSCPLPTMFTLQVEQPFEVFPKQFSLLPKKSGIVRIDFNPALNQDRNSKKISEKILIKHNKNPKNETFDISAQFCYPNLILDLDKDEIDFGAVMNDTSKKIYVQMRNNGVIPVDYEWFFVDDGQQYDVPLNEVFDILPLRGRIEPGLSEQVEFSYYAIPFNSFKLTAVCKTKGGPEYFVKINAEASDVAYNVILPKNKNFIDFGEVFISQRVSKIFELQNQSKVAFEYSVRLDSSGLNSSYMKNFIFINPSKGTLKAKENVSIRISMIPGFPNEINEHLILQVAHFEPEKIFIKANGIFPSLKIDVPRKQSQEIYNYLQKKCGYDEQELNDQWYDICDSISNDQLIQIEKNIIKNHVKKNIDKIICENMNKSQNSIGSKKIITKKTTMQISSRTIQSQRRLDKQCSTLKKDLDFIKNVVLGTYVIDMGTVIAGNKAKKNFKIYNIGSTLLSLDVINSSSKQNGLQFSINRITKLPFQNKNIVDVSVTLTTKKTTKANQSIYKVPLQVKDGGQYILEIIADINVPELQVSKEVIDYGQVIVGQTQISTLRLTNSKVIPCEWNIIQNQMNIVNKKKKKIYQIFYLSNTNGYLNPQTCQDIQIRFEPRENQKYEQKFLFKFTDSNKKLEITVKGIGVIPQLQFTPEKIVFKSCLPNEIKFQTLKITNQSNFDLDLLIPNLNEKFLQEYIMFQQYDQNYCFKEIRKSKDDFWNDIKQQYNINLFNQNIDNEIEQLKNSEEPIEDLDQQIRNLLSQKKPEAIVKKQIRPVDIKDQINVLFFSNKPKICENVAPLLSQKHLKQIIDISQLIDWHQKNNTDLALKVQKLLEQKQEQLVIDLADQKKKGKKAQPINEMEYMYIGQDLFKQLLQERLEQEDCVAGCIFINIQNQFLSIEDTLKIILQHYEDSNVYIFELIDYQNQSQSNLESDSNQNEENQEQIQEENNTIQKQVLDFLNKSKTNMRNSFVEKLGYSQQIYERESIIFDQFNRVDDISEYDEDQQQYEQIKNFFDNIKDQNEVQNEQEEILQDEQEIDQQNELEQLIENDKLLNIDNIQYFIVPFPQNFLKLNFSLVNFIPDPIFIKPEQLPISQDQIKQVLKQNQLERKLQEIKEFQLYDFIDLQNQDEEINENNYQDYLKVSEMKWSIPKNESIFICVKFNSDKIGEFKEQFIFETNNTLWNNYYKGQKFNLQSSTIYPEFERNFNNIFDRIKKQKQNQKGILFKRSYITSDNMFTFGSLLLRGDDDSNLKEEYLTKTYSTKLKFQNISPFPIEIQFEFEIQQQQEETNKKNKKQVTPVNSFQISQNILQIEANDTKYLSIEAYPQTKGELTQNLICKVTGNPKELVIPFHFIGEIPCIQSNQNFLDFDRLILNKSSQKKFILKNTSLVNTKWRIKNIEELKEQNFEIDQSEGIIKVNQEQEITIKFKAINAKKIEKIIQIEIFDCENRNIQSQEDIEIKLQAEGFEILVDFLGFENQDQILLDFGTTLVNQNLQKQFQVLNKGLYPIDFDLLFVNKNMKNYFEVEPKQFQLNSNESKNITINFKSTKEIQIKSENIKQNLVVRILEKKSQEVYNQIRIPIQVTSHFSKFIINPKKSLNFGPINFQEQRVRTFEIINQGTFKFQYELFDLQDKKLQQEIIERFKESTTQDSNKNQKKNIKEILEMRLDQFQIEPKQGLIQPGSSQEIQVTFIGSDNNWHQQQLGIEISNRDFNVKDEKDVYLELIGESCIPSIETKNFRNIFEEQVVTESLTSMGVNIQNIVQGNVYCIEDNTFYFGNIIPSKYPDGITEKFKLINNGKVKVELNLKIQTKNNSLEAFKVEPQTISINPHESTFAKITFKPEIMSIYEATFIASVQFKEKTNQINKFIFDIKGEGILPTLRILNDQKELIDFGNIRQNRVTNKQIALQNNGLIPATVNCTMLNQNGFRLVTPNQRTIMPKEICKFEIEFQPKEKGQYENDIIFETVLNPFEVNKLQLKGQGVFEKVSIEGLSQNEILDFGGIILNPEQQDRLSKKQFILKNYSNNIIRFEWNNLPSEFDWVRVVPQIGHLGPQMEKKIRVYLMRPSQEKSTTVDLSLKAQLQSIQLELSHNILKIRQWDSNKKIKKTVTEKEFQWYQQCKQIDDDYKLLLSKNSKAKKQSYPDKPIVEDNEVRNREIKIKQEEPQFNVIEKIDQNLGFKIKAKIDIPNLECKTNEIYFQKTDMFCQRIVNVQIENKSCVDLEFNCEIIDQYFGTLDNGYYQVIPNEGIISKESIKEFIIKFSPTECDQFKLNRLLFFRIKNSQVNHQIILKGQAERPICHFEIPFQISENKEKIIEIESLGYKNNTIKKFYILNPTALTYDFVWNSDNSLNGYLKCLTPKGTIFSGKKFECSFEFNPSKNCPDKIFKTFQFKIPKHGIKHEFLIKAYIIQPKLFFSQPKVDFGPLLLSGKGRETIYLKNLDDTTYNFSFQRQSIKGSSQSHYNCLTVQPLNGQIGPQKDFAIQLNFSPKCEVNFNYNLICNIKSKKQPLTLNIKGIGYKLKHQVILKKRVVSQHFLHQINFTDIYVNEVKKQSIILENNGDFNFEFSLTKKKKNFLKIEPECGTVKKKQQQKIDFIFQPNTQTQFNTKVKLQIQSGPTYQFQLTGKSLLPQLVIKPSIIDFGNVLVGKNFNIQTKEIKVINNDQKTLILDKDFEKNEFLNIKPILGESILPYNNNKDNILKIPVQLNLKKLGKFQQKIIFKVNQNHKIEVLIKGEGVALDLELENPSDSLLDFGQQKIGQQVEREVKIFNNSKVPVNLNFDIKDQLKKLYDIDIVLNPLNLFIPQKSFETFHIIFCPKKRIRNFQQHISYNLQNTNEVNSLLQVKGACYAVEVKLMEENIDFSGVVVNSSLAKKFDIINLGDLNTVYNWDIGQQKQFFEIQPQSGVLMSNQRLTFNAIFKPKSLKNYKAVAKLNIKNSENQSKLIFQGMGISTPPEAIKTLEFQTPVRTIQEQQIQLKNNSDNYWIIYPNINYENNMIGFFQTENKIEISPGQTKDIKVCFKPFLQEPQNQKANLFLPLNDGNAIIYNLQGTVLSPQEEEIFELDLKTKEIKKFNWQIKNWLQQNQRLQVSFKLEDDKLPIENGIIVNSGKVIDLTSNQIQQYNMQISVIKAGKYILKSYFKNLQNSEYLYYKFILNVTENQNTQKIEMTSSVREKSIQYITIENPLLKDVYIEKNDVVLNQDLIYLENEFPIKIKSNFEQVLKLAFRPLTEFNEKKIDLKINNTDLGTYRYQLILNSKKSTIIPTINFKAKIGNISSKTFTFQNYLNKPSAYTCSIRKTEQENLEDKQADFIVQQNFQAQQAQDFNGILQNIEIKYEPSKIGPSKSLLNVTNSEGGTFQAYLIGHSQPSLPKGPFKVTSKGIPIEFKNPFFYATDFSIVVDNPQFVINQKPQLKLEAKKVINISGSENGRLIIETKDNIQWVFYLQGIK